MARAVAPVPIRAPVPPGPMLTLADTAEPLDTTPLNGESGGGPSRWMGGFTYAPENQFAALLRDACDGATLDLPALAKPVVTATPHTSGGTLDSASDPFGYVVTATDANGETDGTEVTATIGTGTTGSVVLTWPAVPGTGVRYSVYGRTPSGEHRLVAGLTTPTYTDTGAATPGSQVPPTGNTTGGKGTYTNEASVEAVPFLVEVDDFCSSFGFEARDFEGRAKRLLDSATPQAIGREFWHGYLSTAQGYPNDFLTNNTLVDLTPGTVPSVARGINILEDALVAAGFGGQGMIHCQPQTMPNLLQARFVQLRGNDVLVTVRGNRVVVDPGYDGLGPSNAVPAAGTAWIYATDMVYVATSDASVFPSSFAEALDRSGATGEPNTIRFRAERFAVALFDSFRHFGCRVTLPS